jgi:glycosyltransferase involved in cell wall biosynthesis
LILNGKTGFLVNTVDEASEAVDNIYSLSRKFCREWAYSKFSRKEMINGYLDVYSKILNQGINT